MTWHPYLTCHHQAINRNFPSLLSTAENDRGGELYPALSEWSFSSEGAKVFSRLQCTFPCPRSRNAVFKKKDRSNRRWEFQIGCSLLLFIADGHFVWGVSMTFTRRNPGPSGLGENNDNRFRINGNIIGASISPNKYIEKPEPAWGSHSRIGAVS